ncbi:type II toxin-antitoxin system RelE/ParE family toxin [Oceanospirillum sediminis]|uniref:Type II toxin-antitoxin system RelE/ParE family toxin n=1 Tax=Oceanospirillum sediminis TaxID=2760088 RepID=A0A839IX55_9GAMM|nr:type II toxin-antitoxin system RelE/ParE family toxin [Oceanospirillum sediminis]MBB1489372.1 type II toxin-antitoxin system RelE/ParE family toxin [Oceanospirillum sediminis]
MNTLLRTDVFDQWLMGLKNLGARARIVRRIEQAQQGNFGDCKPVGDGVHEMRIHTGPGYRVYYTQRGQVIYLLLCGGDKSTQVKDIKQAKKLAKEIKE